MDEARALRIVELYRQGVSVEQLAERFGTTVANMKTLLANLAKQGYLPKAHGRVNPPVAPPLVKETARVAKSIRIRPEVWERLRDYVAERRLVDQESVTTSEVVEQAVEEYLGRHASFPSKKKGKQS